MSRQAKQSAPTYTWHVESLSKASSASIAEISERSEDREARNLMCDDGRRHNLYQMDKVNLQYLIRSREEGDGLDFTIWHQLSTDVPKKYKGKLEEAGRETLRKQVIKSTR